MIYLRGKYEIPDLEYQVQKCQHYFTSINPKPELDKLSQIQEDIIKPTMDPQTLSNLDPKLKETYERVMGAKPANPTPPAATPGEKDEAEQSHAQSTPTSTLQDINMATTDTTQPHTEAQIQNPAGVSDNNTQLSSTPDGNMPPTTQTSEERDPQTQTVTISEPLPENNVVVQPKSGHDTLLRIFYILGSAVFFLVYAFFWMRIFDLSIPGLSF